MISQCIICNSVGKWEAFFPLRREEQEEHETPMVVICKTCCDSRLELKE